MFAFRKRAPMSPQGNLVMLVWELGHCVWTKTTDNPVIVLSVVSNTPNISGRMLLHIVRHFAAYCEPCCCILWAILLHIVGHVAEYCGPCCCLLWTMLLHIVDHVAAYCEPFSAYFSHFLHVVSYFLHSVAHILHIVGYCSGTAVLVSLPKHTHVPFYELSNSMQLFIHNRSP